MTNSGSTIPRMGRRKKSDSEGAKSSQGRSPHYQLFVRIDPDLGDAFQEYLDETEPKPTTTSAVELAIKLLLKQAGRWPRSSKKQED